MNANDEPTANELNGVGGWLLFLCFSFTVLSPILSIVFLVTSYNEVNPHFDQFPGLLNITVVDGILTFGMIIFSIYAGISLWQIRPGAVNIAKKYLLAFLGYTVLASLLPFMAGLPSEVNEAMMREVATAAIRSFVYVAVWYSYLNKSKRVKATYGLNTDRDKNDHDDENKPNGMNQIDE